MIEINLLPPELRPVERTPLPRFLVWCVGAAVAVAGGFLLVFMYLKWLPDLKQESATLDEQISQKQALAAEADKLDREIAEIGKRQKAIEQLWKGRTIWWAKLDQLVDLVPEYVGLESLSFKSTAARGPAAKGKQVSGKLRMKCVCSYPDEARLAEFRDRLRGAVPVQAARDPQVGKLFIEDFYPEIIDLGWEQKEAGPGFEQTWILEFSLELELKPKVKPAPPTAPGAPAPAK